MSIYYDQNDVAHRLPPPPAGFERIYTGKVEQGDACFDTIDEAWSTDASRHVLGENVAMYLVARRGAKTEEAA